MRQTTDVELTGELETIATAAADRMRALSDGDVERETDLRRRVGEAASCAIAARLPFGVDRGRRAARPRGAREELGRELLRRVERAAGRRRDAEREYEQAVVRACRVGLAHRDVAAAAQVAHGTVRAIVARTNPVSAAESRQPPARLGLSPSSNREDAPQFGRDVVIADGPAPLRTRCD